MKVRDYVRTKNSLIAKREQIIEEVKVGNYIRTKKGIHKVFKIRENAPMNRYMCDKKSTGEWDGSYEYNLIRVDDILDVSSDIIDLIRVGDYVNGRLVFDINGTLFVQEIGALEDIIIKSIVTHEQFENMEYRIGD